MDWTKHRSNDVLIGMRTNLKIKSGESSLYVDSRMPSKYVAGKVVLPRTFEWTVRALKARLLVTAFQRHMALKTMLPSVATATIRTPMVTWSTGAGSSANPRVAKCICNQWHCVRTAYNKIKTLRGSVFFTCFWNLKYNYTFASLKMWTNHMCGGTLLKWGQVDVWRGNKTPPGTITIL